MIRRFIPSPLRRLQRRLQTLDRLGQLDAVHTRIDAVYARITDATEALGRIESRQTRLTEGTLADHEFRVFSHAGEDGILQYLIGIVPLPARSFIEFGVQDYTESNTRFLAVQGGWRGLVLDGDATNIDTIRADRLFLNADLTAIHAFVTRENINSLLTNAGFSGDIGILSIDVDGNDYWIFDAIESVRPAIAVVEYNHRMGPTKALTIPYDPDFVRRQTDASWLYCGASLKALVNVAERKGMAFVGCNTFGNNAFFVRDDLRPSSLPRLTAEEGFQKGQFREIVIREGVQVVAMPDLEQKLQAEAELVEVL